MIHLVLASGSELFWKLLKQISMKCLGVHNTAFSSPKLPFSFLYTLKLVHILFILFQYAKSVSLTNEKVKTHKKQGRFQVGRGDSDDSSEGNNRIFVINVMNP